MRVRFVGVGGLFSMLLLSIIMFITAVDSGAEDLLSEEWCWGYWHTKPDTSVAGAVSTQKAISQAIDDATTERDQDVRTYEHATSREEAEYISGYAADLEVLLKAMKKASPVPRTAPDEELWLATENGKVVARVVVQHLPMGGWVVTDQEAQLPAEHCKAAA